MKKQTISDIKKKKKKTKGLLNRGANWSGLEEKFREWPEPENFKASFYKISARH